MSSYLEIGIPAALIIRRNADGVVRRLSMESMGGYHGDYIWSEGNFSCDCNRGIFFAEAEGELNPDRDCGDDAFAVRIIADNNGHELYSDGDWVEPKL